MGVSKDFVDRVIGEWSAEFPDADLTPIAVVGRISRIAASAGVGVERLLISSGISRAEFDVLSALRRSNQPLRASEVTSTTMLSGASTTKISERLVREGLIERLRLERDARVVLLALTDRGRALVDQVFPVRIEQDRALLDGLDADEVVTLTALLRKVARNAESG